MELLDKKDEADTRDKRPGKLLRRKSFKSVESFLTKILKSLRGSGGGGGATAAAAATEDDGGFGGGRSREAGEQVRRRSSGGGGGAEEEEQQTPGALGLRNHGNTCFMNAVVQCLSNTDLLAEHLSLGRGRGRGRGEVTERLAALVRALWTRQYTPQLSADFKTTVAKHGAQFRGNSQHDALEFLLWLLDRLHEDVHSREKTDEARPSAAHMKPGVRHSFVEEHFQARYKSSLTCPHCLKQSNTFDPFLCVSLPIPSRQTRPLCVTLVMGGKGRRFLRAGLAVPLCGTVASLRRMVAEEGGVSPEQVILTELYASGLQRSFFDDDDLTCIAEDDVVYAFQAPPLYVRGGATRSSGFHHSLPSSPLSWSVSDGRSLAASSEFLSDGQKVLLLVCNVAGAGQQAVRFGPPFVMREDRGVSWEELQQNILSKLYYLMINGSHAQNFRLLFRIRVVGGSATTSYLDPREGRPLHHPAVLRALKLCGSGGPPHVKLIVEWQHRIKDCLFGNIQEEVVKDLESVREQQQQHTQPHSCSLDDSFQLYTKEEQLAPDDAWKCPHCEQLQQGTVQMSLWTLPDILILHLKRFRQVGERRNKLSTQVRFPLSGLDMGRHVGPRGDPARPPQPPDLLYDLYAVCNHHGGLQGGHYTACCRNSLDGRWYAYDDSSVEPVPQTDVCTRSAYILFYHRRAAIPAWSASASLQASGSTHSSASDHWLVRLSTDGQMSGGDEEGGGVASGVRGAEPAPLVRGHSASFRSGSGRFLPLRWSFRRRKRAELVEESPPLREELVEYLESGRRPRCTQEPIASLVTSAQRPRPQGSAGRSGHALRAPPRLAEGQSRAWQEGRPRVSSRAPPTDRRRAHGSCDVPPLKRTLSLPRPLAAAPHRLRYSSASLGPRRPVPESCF